MQFARRTPLAASIICRESPHRLQRGSFSHSWYNKHALRPICATRILRSCFPVATSHSQMVPLWRPPVSNRFPSGENIRPVTEPLCLKRIVPSRAIARTGRESPQESTRPLLPCGQGGATAIAGPASSKRLAIAREAWRNHMTILLSYFQARAALTFSPVEGFS